MPIGRIKWFNDKRGYGFIEQDDGNDIFMHHSAIQGQGVQSLSEGDEVQFEIEQGPRGPKAVNVVNLT